MKHKIYGYLCVITGWDVRCMASTEWMNEMNVDGLEEGADQPFYKIFVDDGSCQYAAQGKIIIFLFFIYIFLFLFIKKSKIFLIYEFIIRKFITGS